MTRVPATIAEFERQYADRSGVSVDWLREHGRIGIRVDPGDCDDDTCEGFHMERVEDLGDPFAMRFRQPDRPGDRV